MEEGGSANETFFTHGGGIQGEVGATASGGGEEFLTGPHYPLSVHQVAQRIHGGRGWHHPESEAAHRPTDGGRHHGFGGRRSGELPVLAGVAVDGQGAAGNVNGGWQGAGPAPPKSTPAAPGDFEDLLYAVLRRKEASVPWSDVSVRKMLAYGTLLYAVEQLFSYPADLLRTRLQVDTRPNVKLWGESWTLCKYVWKKDGVRGFFKGFPFWVVAGVPAQLLFLATYSSSKELMEKRGGGSMAPFAAGMIAEGVTAAFWVPLDIVIQRVQIQGGLPGGWGGGSNVFAARWAAPMIGGRERGGIDVIREMWREDGFSGFYRGTGAHMLALMPFAGVWWGSYEKCKTMMAGVAPSTMQGTGVHLCAGMVAGAAASVVTNPIDTVKVRLQTKIADKGGAWMTFRRMISNEGLSSLTKGLAPRLTLTVPISALSGVCYELVMTLSRN